MFLKTRDGINFNLGQVQTFTEEKLADPDGKEFKVVKLQLGDGSQVNLCGKDADQFLSYVVSTPLSSLSKPLFPRA